MKDYKLRKKCWCGGPERCEICMPTTQDKKNIRRRLRKKNKQNLNKEEHISADIEKALIKSDLQNQFC